MDLPCFLLVESHFLHLSYELHVAVPVFPLADILVVDVGVIWVDVRVPLGTSENCPAIRSNFIYCRISRVPSVFPLFILENIMSDWGFDNIKKLAPIYQV